MIQSLHATEPQLPRIGLEQLPRRVGLATLLSGALALGKAIAGPGPNVGPSPGRHKGVIFLPFCTKWAADKFFWVMRFNAIGKGHLKCSKKVRLKGSLFLSKITMNYESHWLEAGETAGFCGQSESMGKISMLMGPLSYRRGPAEPPRFLTSCEVPVLEAETEGSR